MDHTQTIIVLLSIIIGLHSVVILTLLAVMIALLIKLQRLAKRVDQVTTNIAQATEWLSPIKVVTEIGKLFGRHTNKRRRKL